MLPILGARRQWWRSHLRALVAATVAVAVMGGSGCTAGRWDKDEMGGVEERMLPIIIAIAKGAAARLPSPHRYVALVGIFAAEQAAVARADNSDSTYLFIEQQVDGEEVISVFQVDTTRKLRVAMNGDFIQEIEQNRIQIWVNPDVDSTIAVTDAETPDPIFREGTFRLFGSGGSAHFDLDSGEHGDPAGNPDFAAVVDMVFVLRVFGVGGPDLRNGAMTANWTDDLPSLTGCASLPESAWSTDRISLSARNRLAWQPVYCVRTSEDRYGALNFTWDMKWNYVLWDVLEEDLRR